MQWRFGYPHESDEGCWSPCAAEWVGRNMEGAFGHGDSAMEGKRLSFL